MDWAAAEALARKPRPCPWCTNGAVLVFMRAKIDPGFMRRGREAIPGPQLRWSCRICGLGEVLALDPSRDQEELGGDDDEAGI